MNYIQFQDDVDIENRLTIQQLSLKLDIQELSLIIDLTRLQGFDIFQSIFAVHFKRCKTISQATKYLQDDLDHDYIDQINDQCRLCKRGKQFHNKFEKNSDSMVTQIAEMINVVNKSQQCCVCYYIFLDQDLVHINQEKHMICNICFYNYLKQSIEESRIKNLRCPNCDIKIRDIDILEHSQELYMKYQKCHQNLEIALNPNKVWCPTIDCNSVIEFKDQSTTSSCQYCKVEVCKECKQRAHPPVTCEENFQQILNEWQENRDTQQCPRCKIIVEKVNGCNHMTCQFCQHEWCWICGSDFTTLHYAIFNPFGCPALIPEQIQQKNWSYLKLISWRVICLILLLTLTPIVIILIAPILCVIKLKSISFYRNQPCQIQTCLIFLALLSGIALIPIVIFAFIIAFLPIIIGLILLYYDERKRLEQRHKSALFRRFQQNT